MPWKEPLLWELVVLGRGLRGSAHDTVASHHLPSDPWPLWRYPRQKQTLAEGWQSSQLLACTEPPEETLEALIACKTLPGAHQLLSHLPSVLPSPEFSPQSPPLIALVAHLAPHKLTASASLSPTKRNLFPRSLHAGCFLVSAPQLLCPLK